MVEFTVPGIPEGKGRPRVTRNGTYTPSKTREYEKKVRLCWAEQSPLQAEITAFFPLPRSLSRKKRSAMDRTKHTKKPDADNLAKAILDALNGFAYKDDSMVSVLSVKKINTEGVPHVDVLIREVEDLEK